MSLRNLLLLAFAVAALAGLAWWQATREQEALRDAERSLLEGFDASRVRALRLDNVERSLQLRIERRPGGEWRIVDPVNAPAEVAVLDVLLDALGTQSARPASVDDLKKVSLDPPRAVLEVEEQVGGELRTRRIEIGAVDLDGEHVFVRSEGRLARTERGLESTLDRDLPEWRSHSVLSFAPRDVVEVHRSGKVRTLGGPQAELDLTFDALLDGDWRATAPVQAQLDPASMSVFLGSIAGLRVHSFIDDPGPLAGYGLESPAIRVELGEARGGREVVCLAPVPGSELWYACRAGAPEVYRVEPDAVMAVGVPYESLLDLELVRVRQDEVERVQLGADGLETTLSRSGPAWRFEVRRGSETLIADEPADAQAVDELLGLLARTHFARLVPERELRDDELLGFVRVEAAGASQGGVLGPLWKSADGSEGVLFRRDGDRLTALLERGVLDAARSDPEHWRSLDLHKLAEVDVARIEFRAQDVERVYVRGDKGRWCRQGSTVEAKSFARLVDGLLSMRAKGILKRGADDRVERPLDVRVVTYKGDALDYTLGDWTDPASGEVASTYRTGKRFARVKPELLAALRELLSQP